MDTPIPIEQLTAEQLKAQLDELIKDVGPFRPHVFINTRHHYIEYINRDCSHSYEQRGGQEIIRDAHTNEIVGFRVYLHPSDLPFPDGILFLDDYNDANNRTDKETKDL